jgi:predicted kinase
MSWTDVPTPALQALRDNLLWGLAKAHDHLVAGTFDQIQPGRSSSPKDAGYITLILLDGVEAELQRRTPMAPTLTITRGLPGSGKTTRAKAWVAENPAGRARVNRDDLRDLLHGGFADQERQITAVRDAAIRALLGRGIDVIVDDTNLPTRHARDLRRLAELAGAGFVVWDLTDVDVDECIARDKARDRTVGPDVIRDMHRRFVAGQPHPLPLPDEADAGAAAGVVPYKPVMGTPGAVLVDIDGTVALMAARSPYDETRVHEDRPNEPIIAAVRAMHGAGWRIVFCSGRTDACRAATEAWLDEHVAVPYFGLHMRAAGDMRKDAIVKSEIFDREIRTTYNVLGVFDDRAQVVRMWRALGLTVFQVAEGDF